MFYHCFFALIEGSNEPVREMLSRYKGRAPSKIYSNGFEHHSPKTTKTNSLGVSQFLDYSINLVATSFGIESAENVEIES